MKPLRSDELHKKIIDEIIKQKIVNLSEKQKEKMIEGIYVDFDYEVNRMIPRIVKENIEDPNVNRGILKEGWIIILGKDKYLVEDVNESRANVCNLRTMETLPGGISPHAEVFVVTKQEYEDDNSVEEG